MRNHLIPVTAAALVAVSSFAFAATQHHASGSVKTYDSKAMTLSLNDGSTYTLPKGFKDPGLKTGEKVNVAWQQNGTIKMVDKVTIEK